MVALSIRRLPASSLVEVIIASAILVLVFSLALGSLARLAVSGPQQLELRGQQLVGHIAAETIRQREWQSRSWHEGSIEIEREVNLLPQTPYLFNLHIIASVRGHQIAQLHQLVYAPPPTPAP